MMRSSRQQPHIVSNDGYVDCDNNPIHSDEEDSYVDCDTNPRPVISGGYVDANGEELQESIDEQPLSDEDSYIDVDEKDNADYIDTGATFESVRRSARQSSRSGGGEAGVVNGMSNDAGRGMKRSSTQDIIGSSNEGGYTRLTSSGHGRLPNSQHLAAESVKKLQKAYQSRDVKGISDCVANLLVKTGGTKGEETRVELAKSGAIGILISIAKQLPMLASQALLVLNKVSRSREVKDYFHANKNMDLLSKMALDFNKTGNTNASAIAAMTLANVIGSEESEYSERLLSNPKLGVIRYVVDALRAAVHNQAYAGINYSVYSLTRALSNLAIPDKNKDRIVVAGALELLPQILRSKCVDGDMSLTRLAKEDAASAVWQLAFKNHLRPILRTAGLLECLDDLLREKIGDVLRKNIKGALWMMEEKNVSGGNLHSSLASSTDMSDSMSASRDVLQASNDLGSSQVAVAGPANGDNMSGKAAGTELTTTVVEKVEENYKHDVMISYCWANKELAVRLWKSLEKAGLSVWIDEEQMAGSTLEAMAGAVEGARVILMIMTQNYKDSAMCRMEAEYAMQNHKVCVPVMAVKGYRPDGWLGMLLGAKLYFDFSDLSKYDEKFSGLTREIQRHTQGNKTVTTKAAVVTKTVSKGLPTTSSTQTGARTSKEEESVATAIASALSSSGKAQIQSRPPSQLLLSTEEKERRASEAILNLATYNGDEFRECIVLVRNYPKRWDFLFELWQMHQSCPALYFDELKSSLLVSKLPSRLYLTQVLRGLFTLSSSS